MTREPSNGGTGIMLNTARMMLKVRAISITRGARAEVGMPPQ